MTLTAGFTKLCEPKSGAIVEIFLANQQDVDTFTLTGDKYSAVVMEAGKVFFKFELERDSANRVENASFENRSLKIDHIIEWFLPKLTTDARNRLQEIYDQSSCGLFAIAKDGNGLFWVVGFSEKFGKERPLELQTGAGDSGKAFTDANGTTLSIITSDNELDREFTGTVPV